MGLRQLLAIGALSTFVSFPFLQCHGQIGQIYPQRNSIVTGDCQADLKPATAVISGGVAASALKPTEAAEQLDKQLALIRTYIQQNQGTLKELERERMIHTEGSVNGQPRDPSFQVAQRLRAEFPADAPVDRILERLMELGMDRFGENMSLPEYRTSIVVVHYEIANFEAQLKQIREHCIAEAWKQWCGSPTTEKPECKASAPPESLQIQSFNLRSTDKLMRADGASDYFRLAIYPSQPPAMPPELLGNVSIHLVGSIVLNNPVPNKP